MQRRVVENAVAAALLDTGGGDCAALVDDDEHQYLALQAAGDGFGRTGARLAQGSPARADQTASDSFTNRTPRAIAAGSAAASPS